MNYGKGEIMSVSWLFRLVKAIVVCIFLLGSSTVYAGYDLYFYTPIHGETVPTGGSDHTFKASSGATRSYTARLMCKLDSELASLPDSVNLTVTLLRDDISVKQEYKSFNSSGWTRSDSDPFLYYIDLLTGRPPFYHYYSFNMPLPGSGDNELRTADYSFRLSLKASGETGSLRNNSATSRNFHYTVYSGELDLNNGETRTITALAKGTSDFCPGDTYLTSVAGDWQQDWWDYYFAGPDICTQSSPNPDGYSTDLSLVMDLRITAASSLDGKRYVIKGQSPEEMTLNTIRVECRGTRPSWFTVHNTLVRTGSPDVTVVSYPDEYIAPIWGEDSANHVYYRELSLDCPMPEPGPADNQLHSAYHRFNYSVETFSDTDSSNDSAYTGFGYTVYSGELYFNGVMAEISDVSPNNSYFCGTFPFIKPSKDVSGTWTDVFGSESFSATRLCTDDTANADGYSTDLHVTSGEADLGTVTGSINGLEIAFNDVVLDKDGGNFTSAVLELPEDVTVHYLKGSTIYPKGLSHIQFDGTAFTQTMRDIVLETWGDMYFHQYGLPFYVMTAAVSLPLDDSAVLSMSTPIPVYMYDEAYQELDTSDVRRFHGFPSNDIVFSAPNYMAENEIYLDENGLTGLLNFAKTPLPQSRTSFPVMYIEHDEWALKLERGQITSDSYLHRIMLTSWFKQDCPGGSCGSGGPKYARYRIYADQAGLSDSGTFGSRFDQLGENQEDGSDSVTWGYFPDSEGTFVRRDNDLPGVFMIPGFLMPDTASGNISVGQALLGSWLLSDDMVPYRFAALHDPANSQATDGDGFFAGFNMGPEFYSGGVHEGHGTILGNELEVRFYSPYIMFPGPHIRMPDREEVKYVLRQGGLTGVFNTAFNAETSGTVKVYNYDISFQRFAFRQDRNRPDGTTFIDGSLTLKSGPVAVNSNGETQEFMVAFTDLDITCNGNLGSGQVDTEPEPKWPDCNGEDDDNDGTKDEGCRTLMYWNMPVLLTAMSFENDPDTDAGAGDCPTEPRKLSLDTLNLVDGLGESINMSALYAPEGTIENQSIIGNVKTWFDKPEQGSKPGFNIRLRKAYLNEIGTSIPSTPGFTVLAGLTDVPLFDDVHLAGQFDNAAPENHKDYQLYMFQDQTDSDSDMDGIPDSFHETVEEFRALLNNDDKAAPKPYFTYSWPATDWINFNYYARYNRAAGQDMPWFQGLKKESNIFNVIKVNSVPDYINPEKTKFSFGVSADISALENFQVDINDVTGGVDSFLHNALGVDASFSLEDILCFTPPGGTQICLNDTEDLMHSITGGDITGILGDSIDTILSTGPLADVIHDAAEGLSLANQIGKKIESILFEPMHQAEDALLAQIGGSDLQGPFKELYNTWAAVMLYNIDDLKSLTNAPPYSELQQMQARVQELHQKMAEISKALHQGRTVFDDAMTALNVANGLIDQAMTEVNRAKTLMAELDSAMNTGLQALLSPDPSSNPMLARIEDARQIVQTVRDVISRVDLGQFADVLQAAALASGSSINTSMIESAQQTLSASINELDKAIAQAENAITQAYAILPLNAMLQQARTLVQPTGPIVQNLDTLNTTLGNIKTRFNEIQTLVGGEMEVLDDQFACLCSLLGEKQGIPGGVSTWDSAMRNARHALDEYAETFGADTYADGALGDYLHMLMTGYPSGTSWFLHVFGHRPAMKELVESAFRDLFEDSAGLNSLMENIMDSTTACLPQPSEDDIRGMIRMALLGSDAVSTINSVFYRQFGMLSDLVDNITTQVTATINGLIRAAADAVNQGVSNSLSAAVHSIGWDSLSPLKSVGIDGYAIVTQDELERLHMEAEFVLSGEPSDTSYNAALDVTSWKAENGKTGCANGDGDYYDVTISTHDVTADMLGMDVGIKTAMLGFTINSSPAPIGLFGNFYLDGELNFETLVLEDLGLELGIGAVEAYFGATGAGRFEQYRIPKAAFFFGKSCDFGVLERLDSEVAEFIGEITPLVGVYVRGSVQVPIYNGGCFFTIGVGADIGAWYFTNPPPATYGGLVGGSAYGQLACLASLKGKVKCIGQKSGSEYKFHGDGWAAAGVGWCSPGSWDSVSDARNDDWCLTGDATFGAEYNHGWEIDGPSVNCCD